MIIFIQRIVHNPRRNQQMGPQMAVSFSRRPFVSQAASKWQPLSAEASLLTFSQQGRQMAVSFSRRQLVSQAVSKWQSLSAEDSLLTFSQQGLQMAVSFSRRQIDSLASQQMAVSFSRRQFDSLARQQMAVSFSRRQFAHFPSPEVSKWQSLSAEDSLLTFIQQGLQMAVSPSRRQFVPLAIGKWQSFPKKRQFVYLTLKEIDKWQFLQTVCLFPGCLVPHRVDEWQFSH